MNIKDSSLYVDAALILLVKGNKILLQHRDKHAPTTPNWWGCFGGGIEPGEKPEETIKRETAEELDYETKNPKLLFVYHYTKEKYGFDSTSYVFFEKYDPSQKLELKEGDDLGGFSFEEICKMDIGKPYTDLLKKAEKILKKRD